jgi:hypothetical protein
MPVHRATANDRTSAKETQALDRLAARLPNGPTAAALDVIRISAYTFGNKAAKRWCQQLVRTTRPLPREPNTLDDLVDGDGVRLEGEVHVALVELWGDCEALLRARHGLLAAVAQPPGRELAPVRTEPMRRVAGLGLAGPDDDIEMVVQDLGDRRTQGGTR